MSQGDIIAFTDDDCYPADNFLDLVVRCFQEDPRLGFIGGRILLHDPEDYRITFQEKTERQGFCPGDFLPAGLFFVRAAAAQVKSNQSRASAEIDEVIITFDPWPELEDICGSARSRSRAPIALLFMTSTAKVSVVIPIKGRPFEKAQ